MRPCTSYQELGSELPRSGCGVFGSETLRARGMFGEGDGRIGRGHVHVDVARAGGDIEHGGAPWGFDVLLVRRHGRRHGWVHRLVHGRPADLHGEHRLVDVLVLVHAHTAVVAVVSILVHISHLFIALVVRIGRDASSCERLLLPDIPPVEDVILLRELLLPFADALRVVVLRYALDHERRNKLAARRVVLALETRHVYRPPLPRIRCGPCCRWGRWAWRGRWGELRLPQETFAHRLRLRLEGVEHAVGRSFRRAALAARLRGGLRGLL
ncbi:hypothetical protein BD626DRAFT_221611 [Schizophyllum amplum]|uniref:Uncharacterized protein n=1 Tax=Schizophyllum amplum TaxID=97359 RepID=A0A550CLJ3_9AGAR|nr:hypothetical protein BD626DRAFT_221611 [Auriculariopsis ampla]